MYQEYKIPFQFYEHQQISFSVEKEGNYFIYRRKCLEEELEKILAVNSGTVIVNPIEPLTKPKELTPYFLISLERSLLIDSRSTKTIFIKFPIEIGIYISSHEDFERLDTFSLIKPKFTLYGNPRQGFICKYYKSDTYASMPDTDLFQEGIMEIKISNNHTKWVEITQIVFNAYGMKIYYDPHKVVMRAKMNIEGKDLAETEFIDAPLESDMKKSLEIFKVRKLLPASTKFMMELGL